MALTDKQEEIISDVLQPLFQYLEKEVIVDIAKRIKNSLAYTRSAELKAESMQKLGYSPARIRKEAMKLLNSDAEFRKMVARNTLEYKKTVKKLLKDIEKEALKKKDEVLVDTANMSYFDDLRIWKEGGKELTDSSFLPQLIEAIQMQTAATLKNLTGTTGFKTMAGFEAMEDLYRRELDKAMIKVCTGTYTREQVVYEVVHDLASSGLRSIDFSSGYTMQLDTAVKLAMRTGAHQVSGKITDENILRSGENLIYVSKHWGARNTGVGHANHEQWQGKVYFVKEGHDYRAEANRIGQDYITDLWRATGYSIDGAHENDPLGLEGYNCRHRKYPWFLGISELPDDDPEPAPVIINGKEYDYYKMTQKMRSMEREIRALKREREAMKSLNMDTKEVQKKISSKIREYNDFCKDCKVNPQINRLRYDAGTSDLKKTYSYKQYKKLSGKERSAHSTNTGAKVYYDENRDYKIELPGYSNEINDSMSKASKQLAKLGSRDGYEHGVFVNLKTGEIDKIVTDELPTSVVPNYKYLRENPGVEVAFLHNHNTDTELSFPDVALLVNEKEINVVAAIRNDGIITVVKSSGVKSSQYLPLEYLDYKKQIEKELSEADGFIDPWKVEIKLRDKAIDDYVRNGMKTYGK